MSCNIGNYIHHTTNIAIDLKKSLKSYFFCQTDAIYDLAIISPIPEFEHLATDIACPLSAETNSSVVFSHMGENTDVCILGKLISHRMFSNCFMLHMTSVLSVGLSIICLLNLYICGWCEGLCIMCLNVCVCTIVCGCEHTTQVWRSETI